MRHRNGKPLVTKYEHWTDGVKANKRFMATLYANTHALRSFTNQQAYMFYWLYHQQIAGQQMPKLDDPFMQMNVRNQLCKLEHTGLLTRIHPGVYKWTPKAHADLLIIKAL